MGRKAGQAAGEGVLFGGQHVQGEVVGRVVRQLVLPGVEQLAAEQGDQRHGQEDQAERQGLPCRRQRMAQQLAEAQAPGQRGAGKEPAQCLEAG
ncbi:hypothetical protein D3C85_631440 [compost metagenome]